MPLAEPPCRCREVPRPTEIKIEDPVVAARLLKLVDRFVPKSTLDWITALHKKAETEEKLPDDLGCDPTGFPNI